MKHPKDSQREVGGGLACRPRNQVMTYVSSRESAKLNYRKALINENTARVTRIHKVLQDSGIKPATCAADVMRVSGRADSASTTVSC
jgi:hypothetical protein